MSAVKRQKENLPVMTYGSETWSLNNAMEEMIAVTQRKMEHIMLGISLRDQKRYTWMRQHTETEDIVTASRWNKHRWEGHVARSVDNSWTTRAT